MSLNSFEEYIIEGKVKKVIPDFDLINKIKKGIKQDCQKNICLLL